MLSLITVWIALVAFPAPPGDEPDGGPENGPDPKRHAAALKIIRRNLDALGGAERILKIRGLYLRAAQGSTQLPVTDFADLWLKKPGLFKQVGGTDIILRNRKGTTIDSGSGPAPLPPHLEREVSFHCGFTLHAFSSLKWKAFFEKAEVTGKRTFGDTTQYIVTLPGAQNGQDLTLHYDAGTFMLDRVVFKQPHAKAKWLTRVIRLRDFKEWGGIRFPSTLIMDKVGWEEGAQKLVIKRIAVNPEMEKNLFEKAAIDYGTVVRGRGKLEGEVRSTRFGALHSNFSDADMAAAGFADGTMVTLTVKDKSVDALYVKTFDPAAAGASDQCRFCVHPGAGYPRLILIPPQGADLSKTFPFVKGDKVIVTAKAKDGESGS